MEFEDGSGDGYGESEEETLSLCDLPVSGSTEISAELGSSVRNSSIDFSERVDFDFNFGFDFDLGRSISTEFQSCPADDLFSDGQILPLTQSNAQFPSSKSNSFRENQILSTEKLQSWRSDSLESRSSYWTSSSSNNSQANSRGNIKFSASQRRNSVHVINGSNKSESNPGRDRSSCNKKSVKWQQFFSVGLSKTPVMQLDDMRLRQQKSLKSRQIEKSDNGKTEQTPMRAKGWMKLKKFTSLNGCMGSVKSVVNCTAAMKGIDDGNLSH